MVRRNTIVVLLFAIIFSSCKKDKNIGSPSVKIISPAGLMTFNVFGTIMVNASVSDANSLTAASVYVINSQGVQVLPFYPINITSNSFTFSIPYVISDIHLASGQYTLVVYASNGTNSTYAYQQIYIDAAPTKREALYAITRNSSGVHAMKIDSAFNVTQAYTCSGDYSSSDVNAYYQQLYITAGDSGNVNATIVPAIYSAWNVPGIISPVPFFTNTYSYGNAAYISLYTGFVKYYDSHGVLQGLFNIAPGFYPIKTYAFNNYLFVEEKSISSSNTNLVLFYSPTATTIQQTVLPGPLVAMLYMDNTHIMVFGNKYSGGPYMEQYNITGNIFFTPIPLPSAKMLSADQVDNNTFIMSYTDGNIYQYTYSPNVINPIISGVIASHIRYDAVNNHVVTASSHYVKEYDYVSGALVNSADITDSVLNVHILNNK